MIILEHDVKYNKKLLQVACEESADDTATFVLKHYGSEEPETFTVNRLTEVREWIQRRGYNESRERIAAIDRIMNSVEPLGADFFQNDDDRRQRLDFALSFEIIHEVRFQNKNGEQEVVERGRGRAKVDLGPYDPYF